VRRLAVEVADSGLLAPELAAGVTRIKGVKSNPDLSRKYVQKPLLLA
jgi:hypothetical protein